MTTKVLTASDRVRDWVLAAFKPALDDCLPSQSPTVRSLKRKTDVSEFESTPRAKRARQATYPLTPSATADGPLGDLPPLQSYTTTTSRSSSPSKKQGPIEAEFSIPAHKFHTRASAKRWKDRNQRQIPLFEDLRTAIHEGTSGTSQSLPNGEVQAQLNKILGGVEECQERDGTEDMWNDNVVYPTLRLAKRLSRWGRFIDVINVKSIDVKPAHLLPRRSQLLTASNIPKKRIAYTIGMKITDDDDRMWKILRDAENHTIAQNRALCAHIDIKTGDTASSKEAKLQQFTWSAAGFAKQEELWLARDQRSRVQQHGQIQERDTQPNVEQLAPVPLFRWTRDKVEISVAVADLEKERIDVLDERKFSLDGDDFQSLLHIVEMMVRVMDWGYTKYLPWFRHLLEDEGTEGIEISR